MTTQELINILEKIKDKTKPIGYNVRGQFRTLDNMLGVNEYEDVIELQHEIMVNIDESKLPFLIKDMEYKIPVHISNKSYSVKEADIKFIDKEE